jgi:glycine cleavage system H protein
MSYMEYKFDKFVFKVKKGLLYHDDGCWVELDGEVAKIGITDFLQTLNGDIAFVSLYAPNVSVKQGEGLGDIETMKVSFELTSPVTGKIIEKNDDLDESPELVNNDPYGAGWLLKIKTTNMEEDLKNLKSDEQYFEVMKKKVDEESEKIGKEQ